MDKTVEEAIHRVAKEELGVDIKIHKMLGLIEYYQSDIVDGHTIALACLAALNGEDFKLNEQGLAVEFFSQVPKNIVPKQREALKRFKIL